MNRQIEKFPIDMYAFNKYIQKLSFSLFMSNEIDLKIFKQIRLISIYTINEFIDKKICDQNENIIKEFILENDLNEELYYIISDSLILYKISFEGLTDFIKYIIMLNNNTKNTKNKYNPIIEIKDYSNQFRDKSFVFYYNLSSKIFNDLIYKYLDLCDYFNLCNIISLQNL